MIQDPVVPGSSRPVPNRRDPIVLLHLETDALKKSWIKCSAFCQMTS